MNLFKKNKKNANLETKTSFVKHTGQYGPTHKKKNTYVVELDNIMLDLPLFGSCKNTPIAVITLNGEEYQPKTDFLKCSQFPNPGASEMFYAHKALKPFMGEKLSSTIVEYLDKNSGKPVLTLYPQNQIFFHNFDKTAAVHIEGKCLYLADVTEKEVKEICYSLNHATRRDLFHQVEKRQKFIQKYNNEQKAK